MRRNLGLCQLVHLRCTAVNSSPKLGEVARSDGGVCDDSMGASVAAWHTPPALRATPSTLEGEFSTKLKGEIATARCV